MKILGTGLSGLVGSRIVEILKKKYDFQNLSRAEGVDIANESDVVTSILSSEAEIIIHLAAKTDVDGCELDKELGKNGDAWKINVVGTQNIANAAIQSGKKIIYISTDFVFDGDNPPVDGYSEEDMPNPINWYGQTKYEAERIISGLFTPWSIIRIAYPYRVHYKKSDFFRAIYERLKNNQKVDAITDHYFCPTFIDDIAEVIDIFIQKKIEGLFHAVGSSCITPYDAAVIIAEKFDFDRELINKTTRANFFKDRAFRPFRLSLKNDKIEKLAIKMSTFDEGINAIKNQMN